MSDLAEYGVLDADDVGDERAAYERGAYLAVTTDLNDNVAEAVALKELGYTDTGIAERLGVAPTTVSGWLDRVRAQYGLSGASITPIEQHQDLTEITIDDLNQMSAAVRGQYRTVAFSYPGVVPTDVLEALESIDRDAQADESETAADGNGGWWE